MNDAERQPLVVPELVRGVQAGTRVDHDARENADIRDLPRSSRHPRDTPVRDPVVFWTL